MLRQALGRKVEHPAEIDDEVDEVDAADEGDDESPDEGAQSSRRRDKDGPEEIAG
jgi:hypothetical protein